ncbi:hypothetical protein SINDD18_00483 [Streptococcus infantis]|uniref:Uncharacterized protein n=1 Tax=Streptococcus infantis TaxID=68892 RepID=A0A139RHU4_9STRE|nr:hypothetical protein [Streptococcus infantis]EPT69962.1 hypothetical protein SAG0066_04700 [Streptococcus agalactiae CCUG 38383]KXU14333.1 hypothetical protein SINDD18_00483 [Streptococcus infantis]
MNEKYLSLLREIHSSTTDIRSSTIVIGFSNDEYNDIAKVYSSKSKYDFYELQSFLEIFEYLEFSHFKKIIIFSESHNLEYESLRRITRISLNRGIDIGYFTGNNFQDVVNFAIKNLTFSMIKKSNYTSLNVVPRRESEIKEINSLISMYSSNLTSDLLCKRRSALFIYGGGRLDQLAIGKNIALCNSQIKTSKEVLNTAQLNSDLIMINGCVLGVVAPGEFEKEGKETLSFGLLNSSAVSFIAPFSTKLSDANELILADCLLEREESFGTVTRQCNEYCVYNNLTPCYVLYGDPNNQFRNSENLYNYFLQQSNYQKNEILISNKSIRYFDTIDGERLMFSDQVVYDDKILIEDNSIFENFIKKIPIMIYNFNRDNSIPHMHPNSNKNFKQDTNTLISQFNNLENYLFDFGKDSKVNFKVKKIINNLIDSVDMISREVLNYWAKNISEDKYRMYDLHYGNNLRIKCTEEQIICSTCNERPIEKVNVSDYYSRYKRIIKICPCCSIIEDLSEENILLKINKLEKFTSSEARVEFSIKNNGNNFEEVYIKTCVRNDKFSSELHKITLEPNSSRQFIQEISLNESLSKDTRIYFTILIMNNLGISLYKRQF